MTIHSQAESYAKHADSYVRGRPEYPESMIKWMQGITAVAPGDVVVDLGAGTGKFTRALVNLGLTVSAVEPVNEMRSQLAASLPEVQVFSGTAQHIDLGSQSVDLVTCAQSFHWFADEPSVTEIARILKLGHMLILVWNQRDVSNPIQRRFEEILKRYQDPETPHSPTRRWKPVIDGSSEFSFVDEARFTHQHTLARAAVADRLRSMSVFATLSSQQQAGALEEINELVPDAPTITLPYVSEAFAYRRVGS